jgi:hypothetical protein
VDFDIIGQYLIRLYPSDTGGKKWLCNGTVHQLFIDFKKAYDSGGKHDKILSLTLDYPGN